MASSKIKGITIEIGGDTTKLGKAIESSEKQTRSLQGELRQVEKLLQMDPGNTELLAQKQKILTDAVKETAEKLDTLRQAQKQVQAQFDKGDIGEDQYRAFQRELIKTEKALDDLESELKQSDKALDNAGDSAKESSDGFTVMKGALADLVANAVSSAVSKIGDLVGALFELSEATEEYRQMQAKLEGSADTFGYSMDFANSKYQEFYKYTGDDQMATNAITNLMGIGAETDTISKIADGATAVWATYGDSIPIESMTEAINETITVGKVTGTMADSINWCKDANTQLNSALSGNKEAQKAFNDALEEGLPVEDAFNEALAKITDSQERADVVAKFLNDTYGDSKKIYDENAKSILDANEAELKLKETQAQLGETMQPVNTAFTNLKSQALEAITPLVEKLADAFLNLLQWFKEHPVATQILISVIMALAVAFGVLATALGIQALISGVTKAMALLNTTLLANPIILIIALIAGLVAGFIYLWNNCDSFREFWINLWTKIKTFFVNAWNAIKSFCTTTIPNLISKIGTWFSQLPGKIWTWLLNTIDKVKTWASNMTSKAKETGSKFISTVVDFIKTLPGKVWTWLVNVVSKVTSWASNMASKAKNAGSKFITSVIDIVKTLPGKVWTWLTDVISKVGTWAVNLASKGKEAGQKLLTSIVDKVKEIPSKMLSIGKDIVSGVWRGIQNSASTFYSNIKGFFSGLVDKAKNALGINSPSKVFANVVGKAIPEGIAKGINDNDNLANDSVKTMSDNLVKNANIMNTATINRQLSATFKDNATANASNVDSLLSKLDGIYNRLNRLQIVLDTGTLVGETIDKIDTGLANRQLLSARGV